MRGGRAWLRQHDLDRPGWINGRRTPAAVRTSRCAVERVADALACLWRGTKQLDQGPLQRPVGLHAAGRTGHEPTQLNLRFRNDRKAIGLSPCDEFEDFAKGARMKRGFTMIDG